MKVSANDVAKYLLEQAGEMSTMKLQKLVFYCQAYKYAWTGRPMFSETVRAWTHGPVVYELFTQHRGQFEVASDRIKGNIANLSEDDVLVADTVLDSLGALTGWELRNRTHEEPPWDDAFDPGEARHNNEITLGSMEEYYSVNS